MIAQLVSRSVAIQDLFAAPFLYVSPSFQRPFAWHTDHAERLLGDIQNAFFSTPDDFYFLGAVLLVRVPLAVESQRAPSLDTAFGGPERVFEIVDGQQRIVTLAILLAVLRDLAGRGGKTLLPLQRRLSQALTPAQSSGQKKLARVQLRGPDHAYLDHCIGEAGACLVPPLNEAASAPQRHLLDIRDLFARQLGELEPGELQRLTAFVLENCALVAVVTNTIDRAYQMFTVLNDTGKPLTRNDILKAELIAQTSVNERPRATAVWDQLEHRLGDRFEDLFSYVRSQAGRSSGQIVEAIRAQVATTSGGAGGFIFGTLEPAGRIVEMIVNGGHEGAPQSAQINTYLRYLNWLQGKEWVPPVLGYWSRHGHDAQALLTFLRALDRFVFGVRILGLGNDKRSQRMAELNNLINAGALAVGPWPSLLLSREELRTLNFNLRDLHRRSPQVCRLVLMRLNEQLGGAPVTSAVPLTIEHVLPLKIQPNSQWRIDFPETEARQKWAACLGNLTLVTSRVNERAGNHDYARKSAIYFEPSAEPMPLLTAELRTVAAWTPQQIEVRLARMNEGIKQLWGFEEARPGA